MIDKKEYELKEVNLKIKELKRREIKNYLRPKEKKKLQIDLNSKFMMIILYHKGERQII